MLTQNTSDPVGEFGTLFMSGLNLSLGWWHLVKEQLFVNSVGQFNCF